MFTRHALRGLLAAAAATVSLAAAVGAETYSIDAVHSSVSFSVRHLVSRTSGRFGDFAGTVAYDPAQPAAARVEATIQLSSIDTGNERRDHHLLSPDFFAAEQFPAIHFVSTAVRPEGSRLMVTGDLTLHGVTRQIVLPVEVLGLGTHPMPQMKGAPVAGFQAELLIKRSDFGVNSWIDTASVVGDDVKVSLIIEAIGTPGAG